MGRSAVPSIPTHACTDGPVAPDDVPAEVLAFIRYCYQRRGLGWQRAARNLRSRPPAPSRRP